MAGATLDVYNYASFTNNGAGVKWIPFDAGGTDYHRVTTMIDPTTGLPRLLFGNDQGVWSILDNDGAFETQIGSSTPLAGVDRNGNLSITQFYYGAAQPSSVAAQIAGALFYGSAQDNGGPFSPADLIQSGNISWSGPGGDAAGVATNQQGTGDQYQYFWPCCGGGFTDFFQVNGIGRTSGLLQASGGLPTPDPQWPFTGGANFAVNSVNGQDILISSSTGRIFSTTNQGVTWFEIGDPEVFNSPSGFSVALAYGAPDPNAPAGIGNLGNFMYVGTQNGEVFITQNGGGSGSSNNWLNISLGLDGSPVQSIVTNPARGSHSAYAVTSTGVFYINDSVALGNDPTNTDLQWVNITRNLHDIPYTILGQAYDPAQDPHSTNKYNQAQNAISSIVADWRYTIPNSANDPNGPGYHPVLYVSVGNSFGNGSGVYQSVDDGLTWTLFPTTTFGAVAEGGYLPHVGVTDLDVSLGNISVNSGMANLAGPYDPTNPSPTADPDVLLATTYGQGQFAINLAPLVFPSTVAVDPSNVNGLAPDGTVLVNTATPTIKGLSSITGFGNATWISIKDMTPGDANFGKVIGGFDPSNPNWQQQVGAWTTDAKGNIAIKTYSGVGGFTTNGLKTIEIYATDDAGAVGNKVTLSFTVNATDLPPVPPTTAPDAPTLAISPFDITGPNKNVVPPYTNHTNPSFLGTTSPSQSNIKVNVELLLYDSASGTYKSFVPAVTTTSDSTGAFTLVFPSTNHGSPIPDGDYIVQAKATYTSPYNSLGSTYSSPVEFILKTHGPTTSPTLVLQKSDDSGIVGDNITNVRKPHFVSAPGQKVDPNSIIQVYQAPLVYDSQGNVTNPVLAQTTATSSGLYSLQLAQALGDGTITLVATAVDAAGNQAPSPSTLLTVTIVTVGSDYSGNLLDYSNSPIVYPAPPSSVGKPITGTISSTLPVSGRGDSLQLAGLTVRLSLTSPNLANLSAVLVSPDGNTQVTLFNAGDLSGTSMVNTTFSSSSSFPLITSGAAPYTGVFYTAGLSQLLNKGMIGTWTLEVTDNSTNTGTLASWSLSMTPKLATLPQPAQAEGALFVRDSASGNGLWYVQPTAPSNVPIWFNNGKALGDAASVPLQGDFDGDGKIDLATYNRQTAVWTLSKSTSDGAFVHLRNTIQCNVLRKHATGRQLRRPRCLRDRCL